MSYKWIQSKAMQISTSLGHLTGQREGNPNYQYDQSIPWSMDPERDIRLAFTQTVSLLESAGMQTSAKMLFAIYKSKEEKGSFLTYCEDQYGEAYDDSSTELLVHLSALSKKTGSNEYELGDDNQITEGNSPQSRGDKDNSTTGPKEKSGRKFKYIRSEDKWDQFEEYYQDWIQFKHDKKGNVKQFLHLKPEIAKACQRENIDFLKLKDSLRKHPSPDRCREIHQHWRDNQDEKTLEEFCHRRSYNRDGNRQDLTVKMLKRIIKIGDRFGW